MYSNYWNILYVVSLLKKNCDLEYFNHILVLEDENIIMIFNSKILSCIYLFSQ